MAQALSDRLSAFPGLAAASAAWRQLPGDARAALALTAALLLGYLTAFLIVAGHPFLLALWFASLDAVTGGLLAFGAARLLRARPLGLRSVRGVLLQGGFGALFAFLWYLSVLIGVSLAAGAVREGLAAAPFGPVALTWQLFQGVTVYAMVLLFVLWRRAEARAEAAALRGEETRQPGGPGSLFLKRDRELTPVRCDEIVSIRAEDGGSAVRTRTGRYQSAAPLSRFEEILGPEEFVRVHRSTIVRLGAVLGAEPAGNGVLLLHLADGATVTTSRKGAAAIKALAV